MAKASYRLWNFVCCST